MSFHTQTESSPVAEAAYGGEVVGVPLKQYSIGTTPNSVFSHAINDADQSQVYDVPNNMALSVFNDKYSRMLPSGRFQTWKERIHEVVLGNFTLDPNFGQQLRNHLQGEKPSDQLVLALADARQPERLHAPDITAYARDIKRSLELGYKGVMSFSGRHLQHGDYDQRDKLQEVFTNCSTAACSFMLFNLLLNGSGVGRDYSSDVCRVNWDNMPNVRFVLDGGEYDDGKVENGAHPDYSRVMNEFKGGFESLREARHKYDTQSESVRWFDVEDSKEGWVKIIEVLETAAWQEKHRDKLFIFNFTPVRGEGVPINGAQGRPASGPLPLMRALAKVASIKGAGMKPWMQALYVDHYLAACVALGGVRRAARMAVKWWGDKDILEFINIKTGGFLQTANNSILVDDVFWNQAKKPRTHARLVLEQACKAAFHDMTGEPGFINVHLLNNNKDGMDQIDGNNYINDVGSRLKLHPRTKEMMTYILGCFKQKKYPFIVNPCSEIMLAAYGGYCVIADVCLANCTSLIDAKDAVIQTVKALMRTNLMECYYKAEVKRTNRIGVGLTGIHEFAWKQFGLGFKDLIYYSETEVDQYLKTPMDFAQANLFSQGLGKPLRQDVLNFWSFLDECRAAAEATAEEYARYLGVVPPHTVTTIKPSGTISKVMNCTEGAHLPAQRTYMRYIQFQHMIGDKINPSLQDHIDRGYPTKDVSHEYSNAWVVGFPTKPPIVDVIDPDKLVTADEAPLAEQFLWLRLLERTWLGAGVDGNKGNQISFTVKTSMKDLNELSFTNMVLEYQPTVKCCSIHLQFDLSAYSYQPEESITLAEYEEAAARIRRYEDGEAYDAAELECEGGVCPIEKSVNNTGKAVSSDTVPA